MSNQGKSRSNSACLPDIFFYSRLQSLLGSNLRLTLLSTHVSNECFQVPEQSCELRLPSRRKEYSDGVLACLIYHGSMCILTFLLNIVLLWYLRTHAFLHTFPCPTTSNNAETTLTHWTRVLYFRPLQYAVQTEAVSAAVEHSLYGDHIVANAAVHSSLHESCGNHIFTSPLQGTG